MKALTHHFDSRRINALTGFADWFYDVMDWSRADEWLGAVHIIGFWALTACVLCLPNFCHAVRMGFWRTLDMGPLALLFIPTYFLLRKARNAK